MITWIINIFHTLLALFKKIFSTKKEDKLPSKKLFKKFYGFSNVTEIPEDVKANVLYHVGDQQFKWLVVFRCPCGCRDIIKLNLLKEARPVWRVKIHSDGDVSVYPSVNRQVNCKSHFNITRNCVRWWDWFEDWC